MRPIDLQQFATQLSAWWKIRRTYPQFQAVAGDAGTLEMAVPYSTSTGPPTCDQKPPIRYSLISATSVPIGSAGVLVGASAGGGG